MARISIPIVFDKIHRSQESAIEEATAKNIYITKEHDTLIVNKRPGLSYTKNAANTYIAYGLYTSKVNGLERIYYLEYDGVEWDLATVSAGAFANVLASAGPSYIVNWSAAGYSGTYPRIAFSLGTQAWVHNEGTTTVTQITDTDFPGGTRGLVWLDDFLFASNGDGIYQSGYTAGVPDIFVWNALDVIHPQSIIQGEIYRIALHNRHLVAFGKESIEIFYNAGNPTPGSALSPRRDIIIENIGLWAPSATSGIAYNGPYKLLGITELHGGNLIAFISSQARSGVLGIHVLEHFSLRKISNDAIDRFLNYNGNSTFSNLNPSLFSFSVNNKSFIGFTYKDVDGPLYYKTFIYDLETSLWGEWNVHTSISSNGILDIVASAEASTGTINAARPGFGSIVMFSDGKIYHFRQDKYQDIDSSSTARDITVTLQTPKLAGGDGEKNLDKYMKEFTIIGDRGASANNVSVQYTDDDYQTFSTARDLDISNANNKLTQLGTFKERALKLTHTANLPLRISGMEAEVSL